MLIGVIVLPDKLFIKLRNKFKPKDNKTAEKLQYWLDNKAELIGYHGEKIYDKQKGKCPLCLNFEEVLHVDHCHKSGKVRGLLCTRCNKGLGHHKDDVEILKKAIKYLRKGG